MHVHLVHRQPSRPFDKSISFPQMFSSHWQRIHFWTGRADFCLKENPSRAIKTNITNVLPPLRSQIYWYPTIWHSIFCFFKHSNEIHTCMLWLCSVTLLNNRFREEYYSCVFFFIFTLLSFRKTCVLLRFLSVSIPSAFETYSISEIASGFPRGNHLAVT